MKDILIDDKRLTPTMERVRSGRTQLFRERNKNDRTFIDRDNADVILEHKNEEMYAELIDGQWYWISGCAECNDRERNIVDSYIECEKHNVCISCFISRKDIKGSVWGGLKGWTCKPCKAAADLERRKAAFIRLDGEEPDCLYTSEIIYPHCDSEIEGGDINESQDVECEVCEGDLSVEVSYSALYSTSIKGERIVK